MSNLSTIADAAPSTELRATTPTPADLLRMAVEGGADLDRLERLMLLQERWESNEARKAYSHALSAFKASGVVVEKLKRVSFSGTSYAHAELSDVTGAIGPALSENGLSFRWDVKQENRTVSVTCILTHVLGHSESITMSAPPDDSGKKNGIQQIASTVTYLQRYTLLAITGTATKGVDDDGRLAGSAERGAASEKDEADRAKAGDFAAAMNDAGTAEALDAIAGQLKAASLPAPLLKGLRELYATRKAALTKAAA